MSLVPNDYDRGFNDAMSMVGPCPHCADKDKRIAELENAFTELNTALNELWVSGVAQIVGPNKNLDAVFDAQNKALCLIAL